MAREANTGEEKRPRGWLRRLLRTMLILAGVILLAWVFHVPLLRAMGRFLVTDDPLVHVDEVFVLGGLAVDRGEEAAHLYAQGVANRFVCTGSQVPGDLATLGIDLSESDMTKLVMTRHGVPDAMVLSFKQGTSTLEEAEALLALARRDDVDTVMVVSSAFHLRRARFVFRERFAKAGITVLFHGARDQAFNEDTWWRDESGLLMVYNEYVKLAYYHLRY